MVSFPFSSLAIRARSCRAKGPNRPSPNKLAIRNEPHPLTLRECRRCHWRPRRIHLRSGVVRFPIGFHVSWRQTIGYKYSLITSNLFRQSRCHRSFEKRIARLQSSADPPLLTVCSLLSQRSANELSFPLQQTGTPLFKSNQWLTLKLCPESKSLGNGVRKTASRFDSLNQERSGFPIGRSPITMALSGASLEPGSIATQM